MKSLIRPALSLLGLFTVITGLLYPLAVTAAAQLLFPEAANGSLLRRRERVVGSALIGQPFADPRYFWGRPSATTPRPYDGGASAGSQLGPTNPALIEAVRGRLRALGPSPTGSGAVPVDLVTASGSGLDPHVSPAAALHQVERVARARGRAPEEVRALTLAHVEGRTFGALGEARVNVLRLNLALEGAPPGAER